MSSTLKKQMRFTYLSFCLSGYVFLAWSPFNDGDPTILECSEGIYRLVGLSLWFLFNLVMTIGLMVMGNIMGNIMSDLQKDWASSWKCHWIKIGLQFCNAGVVLPPPMNLLDAIITLPVLCCKRRHKSVVKAIKSIIVEVKLYMSFKINYKKLC